MGTDVQPRPKDIEYLDVTIASAASLTAAIDLKGRILAAVIMPAAWTAANLTFEAAEQSDGTYNDVYVDGTEKTLTAAVDRYVQFAPADWLDANFIKIRSGTSATPVAQGAERTLVLALIGR